MKVKHFSRLLLVALTALMSSTPRTLFAQHSVDPATLNPPVPPQYNPVCKSVGPNTICTVQFSDPPFAGGRASSAGREQGLTRCFKLKIGLFRENATMTRMGI